MRTVRILSFAIWAFGCAHVYSTRPIESNPTAVDFEAKARGHFEKQARHEYAAAFADFDDGMKVAVPLERVEKNWIGFEERWGAFVGIEGARAQAYGDAWAAIVVIEFASDVHTFSVYFDSAGLISGSWVGAGASASMFIDALGHHRPDWAFALSDGRMQEKAPPRELEKIWSKLEGQFGRYERVIQSRGHGLYANVIAAFGQTPATFKVGLDSRGHVTGFHVVAVGERPGPKSDPAPRQEPQLDFDRQSGSTAHQPTDTRVAKTSTQPRQ
jgi:hypothetical protein